MLAFYGEIANLSPGSDAQRALKARALQAMTDLAQTLFQMYVQENSGLPVPFLIVVVLWLVILFGGYGLIAPRNPTVVAVLLACTISVAGGVFLILELADPLNGLVRISSEPLRQAFSQLGG